MADKTNSLYGMICEIVRQETIYLRHYEGKVLSNTDELSIGRCQVSIPALGWEEMDLAPWCKPRQAHRMSVPMVGEWVDVYFLEGNMNQPVYLEICNNRRTDDNKFCVPEGYIGDTKKHVIFQSPLSKASITQDDTIKKMTFDSEALELILASVEPFVLGAQLNTYITNFITAVFNTHTHICSAPTSASSVPTPLGLAPSGILSTKIMGQ